MRLKNPIQLLITLTLTTLLASVALADTLVLRNGSILKGTFVGFENGEFIFRITSGDNRNQGRTVRFPARDVTKLTLDDEGRDPNSGRDPRNDGYPRRDPNNTGGSTGRTGGWRSYPPIEVRLADQWIRTDIELRRGQRVRVEASGTIRLEGRTPTGPEGLRNRADQDAPEPNEADGVLLAGVGQDDSSPIIVIGRSREFTADRDGRLYFTVNHGDTRNATGSFQVRVQVDESYGGPSGGNTGNNSRGQERTITVQANQPWVDTGIEVEPGMTFEITAEGGIDIGQNWRNVGPEGERRAQVSSSRYPVQDAGVGALLTKIRYRDGRESNILVVGRSNSATAEPGEYGRLMLGINDDYFRDNSGSFRVRIRW
jgi:hypothetical protein